MPSRRAPKKKLGNSNASGGNAQPTTPTATAKLIPSQNAAVSLPPTPTCSDSTCSSLAAVRDYRDDVGEEKKVKKTHSSSRAAKIVQQGPSLTRMSLVPSKTPEHQQQTLVYDAEAFQMALYMSSNSAEPVKVSYRGISVAQTRPLLRPPPSSPPPPPPPRLQLTNHQFQQFQPMPTCNVMPYGVRPPPTRPFMQPVHMQFAPSLQQHQQFRPTLPQFHPHHQQQQQQQQQQQRAQQPQQYSALPQHNFPAYHQRHESLPLPAAHQQQQQLQPVQAIVPQPQAPSTTLVDSNDKNNDDNNYLQCYDAEIESIIDRRVFDGDQIWYFCQWRAHDGALDARWAPYTVVKHKPLIQSYESRFALPPPRKAEKIDPGSGSEDSTSSSDSDEQQKPHDMNQPSTLSSTVPTTCKKSRHKSASKKCCSFKILLPRGEVHHFMIAKNITVAKVRRELVDSLPELSRRLFSIKCSEPQRDLTPYFMPESTHAKYVVLAQHVAAFGLKVYPPLLPPPERPPDFSTITVDQLQLDTAVLEICFQTELDSRFERRRRRGMVFACDDFGRIVPKVMDRTAKPDNCHHHVIQQRGGSLDCNQMPLNNNVHATQQQQTATIVEQNQRGHPQNRRLQQIHHHQHAASWAATGSQQQSNPPGTFPSSSSGTHHPPISDAPTRFDGEGGGDTLKRGEMPPNFDKFRHEEGTDFSQNKQQHAPATSCMEVKDPVLDAKSVCSDVASPVLKVNIARQATTSTKTTTDKDDDSSTGTFIEHEDSE